MRSRTLSAEYWINAPAPSPLRDGPHGSVDDGDQRSHQHIKREIIMETTTHNYVPLSGYAQLTSLVLQTVYCKIFGFVPVSERQTRLADTLAFYVNEEDGCDLDAVTEAVVEEEKVVERRVRRGRVAPFASWLVGTIRGLHLSQCERTESNVLVFERHARSLMSTHGVRPTDAARVLPLATALFFDHKSVDQIDAIAITQAQAFKSSRKLYSSKYFSWGWASSFHARA